MELIKVAEKIEEKIKQLEKGRGLLDPAAKEKAKAISEYDKVLAVEILKMKEDQPATLCEKLAKGKIYQERYQLELAESGYKSLTIKMKSLESELNGYQSIFRYLDEK